MYIVAQTAMDRVQILCCKHGFGTTEEGAERYETLMVAGANESFKADVVGTELEKISLICKSMADGCMMLEHKFREMFPRHVCGEGCRDWRPLWSDKGTDKLQ